MRKVVVFGGGTGTSSVLSGLKLFPMDVTAVITVSDNGSSTGMLKQELNIPAVGDVGKVLLAMSNVDDDFVKLLGYRFAQEGSLHNHPIRNIMLAALIDMKGSFTEAAKYMADLLKIKGTVLPLTEEKVDLVGLARDCAYFGEEAVSQNISNIERLTYDHEFSVRPEILEHIRQADLIILSTGSLYTSIIPHLLSRQITGALAETRAPIMYVSNLVTQSGETDDYHLSSHIEIINRFLQRRRVDYVVANNAQIDPEVSAKYLDTEGKRVVTIDDEAVKALGAQIIAGDIFCIDEEGKIRHNALKTAYMIFSWLMDNE